MIIINQKFPYMWLIFNKCLQLTFIQLNLFLQNHVIAQSQGAKLFMDWVNDPKRPIDTKNEHTKPEVCRHDIESIQWFILWGGM